MSESRLCRYCQKPLIRKRRPNGRLEQSTYFAERKFCNVECRNASGERRKAPPEQLQGPQEPRQATAGTETPLAPEQALKSPHRHSSGGNLYPHKVDYTQTELAKERAARVKQPRPKRSELVSVYQEAVKVHPEFAEAFKEAQGRVRA